METRQIDKLGRKRRKEAGEQAIRRAAELAGNRM